MCRAEVSVSDKTKSKLADLCGINLDAIWTSVTVPDTSELPWHFYEQGILQAISKRFGLTVLDDPLLTRFDPPLSDARELEVAVIGKYDHQDAYISIFRALDDAARACDVSLSLARTSSEKTEAVCVPGGFGARGFEELVELCSTSRGRNLPFLGICWGLQAAVVSLARAWGDEKATSEEVEETAQPPRAVVVKRPDGILRKGG